MPLAAGGVALVLRTRGRPGPVMADVGRAVSSVEPGDIVYDVKTLDDILATSLAPRRVTMMLLAAFAGPVETPCALFRLERDRQHAIVDDAGACGVRVRLDDWQYSAGNAAQTHEMPGVRLRGCRPTQ